MWITKEIKRIISLRSVSFHWDIWERSAAQTRENSESAVICFSNYKFKKILIKQRGKKSIGSPFFGIGTSNDGYLLNLQIKRSISFAAQVLLVVIVLRNSGIGSVNI